MYFLLSMCWDKLLNKVYQHMYGGISKRFVFIIFGIAQESLPTVFIYVFDESPPESPSVVLK